MAMKIGDQVTVRPPFDGDPILVEMQRHARVAEVLAGGTAYMIALCSAYPAGEHFGPYSADRLTPGWSR